MPISEFGWRGRTATADWLFAEPWEFEFFQAVRLLECMYPRRVPPGEGADPEAEVVRFRSAISHVFAGAEVQALRPPGPDGSPAELTANLFGLGGPSGPLPDADADRAIAQAFRKDFGFVDFLDIFHHRILALLVRTRKAHCPSLTRQAPHQGPFAEFLYAFFGLGAAGLRHRMRVEDRSLIFYSGILSQQPRSSCGLERLLSDYFQTPAHVDQMIGEWRDLEPSEWTRLGAGGQNQGLGAGAVAGRRIWDQGKSFEIRLGPLGLRQFLDFLPIGSAFGPLCELTRFYAGPDLDFTFRLTLRAAEVPQSRPGSCRLGWTSWLNTRGFSQDDSQARLHPRTPADPFARRDPAGAPRAT